MITGIEEYFTKGCGRCNRFGTGDCATQLWAGGLAELRRICRGQGLEEVVKWGHPCYVHGGRNIAVIGALRNGVRLSFFEAGVLTDPDGVLERAGPNTAVAGVMRFDGTAAVLEREPVIAAYLAEAMGYAEAGIRAEKIARAVELPDELVEVLDADPELAEAFAALTPGRQRSYVLLISAAKQPATRVARIARARGRILDGKGAQER